MSDPKRMLGGNDDVARALLRSAKGDHPSAGARRRTAAAIGIAVGAAAGGAGTTAAAAGGAPLATLAVKIIAAGAIVSAATVAIVESRAPESAAPVGSVSTTREKAEAPALPPSPTALSTPAPPPEATIAPAPPPDIAPAAAPTATSARRVTAPPARTLATPGPANPPAAASASPSRPPSNLAEEVAILDRARAALDRGATDAALDELDGYARAFPRGALAPEASVIRLEALARRGSCDEVRSRARAFLDAQPNAPQASHVRAILETCSPK